MRVSRGLLGWGVFLVALGAVPLAVRSGAIDAATAARAWELWPLLLIGGGLGLALRRTRGAALGNVVIGLAMGVMVGGLAAGGLGSAPLPFCVSDGTPSGVPAGPSASGTLPGSARVVLRVDCGALTVGPQPGDGWTATSPEDPDLQARIVPSPADELRLEFGRHGPAGIDGRPATWAMTLPTGPSIDLDLTVNAASVRVAPGEGGIGAASVSANASDVTLDLGGSRRLLTLRATANASSLRLSLPTPDGTLAGTLRANAGELRVCVPPGVALRIVSSGMSLGSTNFADRGLTRSGDVWTRGAAGSGPLIDLSVSASVGSVVLDPEGGCG